MKEKTKGWSVLPFFFLVLVLHWILSLLATSNLHKYPIFHTDAGLWIHSTTDFSNSCTWEVPIVTLCLITNVNWCALISNYKVEIEVKHQPCSPESATGALSTSINPKLTQMSWGCFNITKAVLMKGESGVLMRSKSSHKASLFLCRNRAHT